MAHLPHSLSDPKFAPFVRDDSYSRELSVSNTIRIWMLMVLVLPVKFLLVFCCLISFYLCCHAAAFLPASRQSQVVAALGKIHCRLCLLALGFVAISWKKVGKSDDAADLPACVVSNHLGWPDILLHMCRCFPSFVARQGTESIPLVGVISKHMQCVFVERENKDASTQGTAVRVKERIERYADDKSGPLRPMLLFPEGTTTNGKYVLPFKTGAFLAGKPVQPVLISYGKGRVSPCWESIGAVRHIVLMLAEPFHSAEYCELPVYVPSPEEAANPRLFAENVKQYMLKLSKLQGSDSTLEDKRQYHSLLRAAMAGGQTNG